MELSPKLILDSDQTNAGILNNSNCRICFDIGLSPLIQACKCIGSSKFVHEMCLKQWIMVKYTQINGAQCEICQYKYSIIIEKRSRCNLKVAVSRNVWSLFVIIINLIVLLTLAIILGLFVREKMDLKRRKTYSIAVLSICSAIMSICVFFIGKSAYKLLANENVSKWTVLPMGEN